MYSRGDFQRRIRSKSLKSTHYSRPFPSRILNWIRPAKVPVSSFALNKVGSAKRLPTLPTNRVKYYTLASLHRRYLEDFLFSSKTELGDDDVFKFITKATHLMSPVSIAETRQLGTFCSINPRRSISEGILCRLLRIQKSLVSFPEFGTKKGRIDFFIR